MEAEAVEIQATPPRTKILKNGAVYDLDKGRIISSKGATTRITTENAAALSRRRQELYRRAAAKGITQATPSNSPVEAWGYVVGDQTAKLLDQRKPNAQAFEMLGRSIGAFVPASEQREQGEGAPTDDIRTVLAQLAEIAKAINHGNG